MSFIGIIAFALMCLWLLTNRRRTRHQSLSDVQNRFGGIAARIILASMLGASIGSFIFAAYVIVGIINGVETSEPTSFIESATTVVATFSFSLFISLIFILPVTALIEFCSSFFAPQKTGRALIGSLLTAGLVSLPFLASFSRFSDGIFWMPIFPVYAASSATAWWWWLPKRTTHSAE